MPHHMCINRTMSFFHSQDAYLYSTSPQKEQIGLVHSFVRSFVHSLVYSIVCSFIRSFVHSLIRSLVPSFVRWFVCSELFFMGAPCPTIRYPRTSTIAPICKHVYVMCTYKHEYSFARPR